MAWPCDAYSTILMDQRPRTDVRLKMAEINRRSLDRLAAWRDLGVRWKLLPPEELATLVDDLREELRLHDRRYYVEDRPLVPDADYDLELRLLRDIESALPELDDPASPTKRVGGAPREAAVKVEHRMPMRSIEDVFGPPNEEAATRIGELNTELCRTTGVARAPDATEAFIVGISGINDVEVVIIAYVTGDFDDVTVLAHDLETCKVMPTP